MPADLPPAIICEAPARAVDGDTLDCAGIRYRAYGFDTADRPDRAPCTDRARRHLFWCDAVAYEAGKQAMQRFVDTERLMLYPTGARSHGRGVARFTIDGRDLGEVLFGMGLARLCPGGRMSACRMPGRAG